MPGPTLWIFESIGLTGFVAVVGLNAGPDFVQGLKASGLSLVAAGAITITAALLIGVCSASGFSRCIPACCWAWSPAAARLRLRWPPYRRQRRSTVPSIGYGVAYAVGNVLLAIWGTVIVALLT